MIQKIDKVTKGLEAYFGVPGKVKFCKKFVDKYLQYLPQQLKFKHTADNKYN